MIYLVSFIGQFIGYLISKLTKEELETGKLYFKLLKIILLIIIIILTLFLNFNIIYLIVGLLLALIIKEEYFYFGLISNNLLFASLIFIYGLPYGSSNKFRKLLYNLPLFFIPLIINFIYHINFSLVAGALITILIMNRKVYI